MIDKSSVPIHAFDIELLPLCEDDLDLLCYWRNHPEILPFMEDNNYVSMPVLKYWYSRTSQSENFLSFMVKYNKRKIGYTELKEINFDAKSCVDGIFLFGEKQTGHNLGKRIFLCREILIKKLQLKTIFSYIRSDNIRSQKFYQKFGSELYKKMDDILIYKNEVNQRRDCLEKFARQINVLNEYKEVVNS